MKKYIETTKIEIYPDDKKWCIAVAITVVVMVFVSIFLP